MIAVINTRTSRFGQTSLGGLVSHAVIRTRTDISVVRFGKSISIVWLKTSVPLTVSKVKKCGNSVLSESIKVMSFPTPTSASLTEYVLRAPG